MKQTVLLFLENFWLLLNAIAVFILIGVLVAGLLKLILPDSFIKKHLGDASFMSSIKAALLGIPLPLCSCSVIPFVSSLKKGGASNSAIQTFLIATPITGADSIMATYGVFGWLFTIYRMLSSIVIALTAGLLTLLFLQDDNAPKAQQASKLGKPLDIKIIVDDGIKKNDWYENARQVVAYAFDDIYKGIAKPLMLGILLGALIMTFMPDNFSQYFSNNQWLNYLLVLVIAVPLYVCATASIPLGLSLIVAGFSPGAAFIFLTAGPATNTITMSVVLKTLGKSSLIIYLSSVVIGSLLFGYLFDVFFSDSLKQILNVAESGEQLGFISQVSAVILFYLSIKYITNKNAVIINTGGGCSGCAS